MLVFRYMSIITIPKQVMREKELVLIPKKEYEALLGKKFKAKSSDLILEKIIKPTKAEKMIIARGRREIKLGRYESWDKVKHDLELTHHR